MYIRMFIQADKNRKRARDIHNPRKNVQDINFGIGEFVLVRKSNKKGHTLSFRWTGPQRIVDVKSNLVFVTKMLSEGKNSTVHTRRLMLYRADMENKEFDTNLIQHADHSETAYQVSKKIKQIKDLDGELHLLIEW